MTQSRIIRPVFLVDYGDTINVLVPFLCDGLYGMKSIRVVPAGPGVTEPTFLRRSVMGQSVLELRPSIQIMRGIDTPDKWRVPYTPCTPEQVEVITGWLSELNRRSA